MFLLSHKDKTSVFTRLTLKSSNCYFFLHALFQLKNIILAKCKEEQLSNTQTLLCQIAPVLLHPELEQCRLDLMVQIKQLHPHLYEKKFRQSRFLESIVGKARIIGFGWIQSLTWLFLYEQMYNWFLWLSGGSYVQPGSKVPHRHERNLRLSSFWLKSWGRPAPTLFL